MMGTERLVWWGCGGEGEVGEEGKWRGRRERRASGGDGVGGKWRGWSGGEVEEEEGKYE